MIDVEEAEKIKQAKDAWANRKLVTKERTGIYIKKCMWYVEGGY